MCHNECHITSIVSEVPAKTTCSIVHHIKIRKKLVYIIYFIMKCIGSGFHMWYFWIFRAGLLRSEIWWFYSTSNVVYYRGKTLIPFSSNICIYSSIQAIHLQYTDWICITDYYVWENKPDPGASYLQKTAHIK